MKGKWSCWLGLGTALLIVGLACTPVSAPSRPVGTPPAAPRTTSPALVPATAAPSAEDAAWAKVVAEARKEGKVTAYTFIFTGDTARAVSKAFEEKYGIKLEFVAGVGAVLLERLKSEQAAKKNIADTLDTATTIVLSARDSGLTEKVADDLPALREKGVWRMQPRHDPEGHLVVTAVGSLTPFINTSRVKPAEEPKSLADLLAPQWKGGKIALYSPMTNPLLGYVYYYREKYGVNEDFFRQIMKQEPRVGPTTREPNYWIAAGEASILAPTSYGHMGPFSKEGAPLKPVEIAGGIILYPSPSIAMAKNAPHPNATRVFINWLLSQEGQQTLAKAVVTTPVRNDVPDFGADTFNFKPRNAIAEVYDDTLKINRLQRELAVAKLMGLEK